MKLKNVFLTLGLALGLGVSAVAGFSNVKEMTKADAVTMIGGEKLYLTPNSNWKTDSARFATYFFNSSSNKWASMTDSDSDGIYEVTVPTGSWNNLIFCRMNPSNTTNDWSNKWNQTGDLVYDGTKNHFTLNAGSWNAGTWSVYGSEEEPEPEVTEKKYYLVGNFNNWNTSDSEYLFTKDEGTGTYTLETPLPANPILKICDGTWDWNFGFGNLTSTTLSLSADGTGGNVKIENDKEAIYLFTLGYDVENTKTGKVELVGAQEFTVTEYDVLDGVLDEESIRTSEQIASYTPTKIYKDGYVYGGVYTDVACTTLFEGPITDAITVYHKYTTAVYGEFYIGSLNYDSYNLYTFGMGEDHGTWPGTTLEADFAPMTDFDGVGRGLMRVEYIKNGGDTHFIINGKIGEDSPQTVDLKITEGAYYDLDELETDYTGSVEMGAQAAYVYDLAQAIAAAEGDSVCNIAAETVEELVAAYDALETTTAVDSATIYTFTRSTIDAADALENVLVSDIVYQLRILAGDGNSLSLGYLHRYTIENSASFIIIIVIATAAVSALGIYLIIKRRKNSK